MLIYHAVEAATDESACQELFAGHGWRGAWRNGIYGFHHFHSTAHEVLGIVAGRTSLILGGPNGRRFEVAAGDVLVLPAGTGHCNTGPSDELLVVGAYPDAMNWDMRRGNPAEHDEVMANIAAVPHPDQDPVRGEQGPLLSEWRQRA